MGGSTVHYFYEHLLEDHAESIHHENINSRIMCETGGPSDICIK